MTVPQASPTAADLERLAAALAAALAGWWRRHSALPAHPDHAGGAPATRAGG